MAEIIFVPVCSNCKRIIFDKAIGFLPGIENSSYSDDAVYEEIEFELRPKKCPHCETAFDSLVTFRDDYLIGGTVTAFERAENGTFRKDVFKDLPDDVNVTLGDVKVLRFEKTADGHGERADMQEVTAHEHTDQLP